MRFAVGFLCVAACATTPAPAPTNVHENRPALVTQTKSPEPVTAPRRPRAAAARLTPDVVLATIRGRYIAGVERCYRRHLKKDAGARGRVLVSFTVDPKGRARDGVARGVTEQVDGCIARQVRHWRFPVPRTHRGSRFALRLELGAS
jgi:hypothetical protein